MTRDDTKKMIMYLKSAFTGAFADAELSDVVAVWHDAFEDESPTVMSQAAKNFVKASKYVPTIAGIQEQVDLIKQTETGVDMWKYIDKALRNSNYHAKEEFENMPEECRRFIGSAAALKELAGDSGGVAYSVAKGQFLKHVDSIRQHKYVQEGLPIEVKQALEESRQRMIEYGG